MSVLDTLRTLAAGGRPVSGLLHTVRLEAFGIEVYGEEAVVESFRGDALELDDNAKIVVAPGHIAVFNRETALVADLHGANIARLWRLGGGLHLDGEREISVVFDPDLTQARGDVFFAASDHPQLSADAADEVRRAGRTIARADDPEDDHNAYRTRAFVIRAFGNAVEGVALFAVYRLTGDPVRESGFAKVAARWTPAGLDITRDRAGEAAASLRPWTPRVPL
jgi:hypothetical protein